MASGAELVDEEDSAIDLAGAMKRPVQSITHLFELQRRSRRRTYLAAGSVMLGLAILPLLAENRYHQHVLVFLMLNSIIVLSLMLTLGFTGQVDLAKAAFAAIGAYTTAILTVRYGLPVPLGIIGAALVSGVIGGLIAFPAIRTRTHYLALITLVFNEIQWNLVNSLEFTGGSHGITGVPEIVVFNQGTRTPGRYFYVVLVALGLFLWLSDRLVNSSLGLALRSVRDNELAANANGVNPTRVKLFIFGVSSAMTGVAGSLYAHYVGYIGPDAYRLIDSLAYLAAVIVGGIGTLGGALVGAGFITILPEFLRFMSEWYLFVFGAIIVAVLLWLPDGIVGTARRLYSKFHGDIYVKPHQ